MHRRSQCKSKSCRATAPPIASFDVGEIPKGAMEEARRRGEEVTHAERCTFCQAVWTKGGVLLGERDVGTTKMLWIGAKRVT